MQVDPSKIGLLIPSAFLQRFCPLYACRELLGLYEAEKRKSADVKKIAKHHLSELKRKEEDLKKLRMELDHLVKACAGDERPDCPIMDYLS